MALSAEDEETLKKQGLEEDIRNQLSNAKTIPFIFKQWQDENDPIKKERLFKLLDKSIGQLTGQVSHICDSLNYFEAKLKTGQ